MIRSTREQVRNENEKRMVGWFVTMDGDVRWLCARNACEVAGRMIGSDLVGVWQPRELWHDHASMCAVCGRWVQWDEGRAQLTKEKEETR